MQGPWGLSLMDRWLHIPGHDLGSSSKAHEGGREGGFPLDLQWPLFYPATTWVKEQHSLGDAIALCHPLASRSVDCADEPAWGPLQSESAFNEIPR